MGASLVRLEHDWASVIGAAQRDVADDQEWASGVADQLGGLLRTKTDATLVVVEHDETCSRAGYRALKMPRDVPPVVQLRESAGLHALGVEGFRAYYYPSRIVTSHHEIERELSPSARELAAASMGEFRRYVAMTDVMGAFAYPEPGIVLTLFAMHDRRVTFTRYERALLTRLMLHLESSYRVRRRPESVVAVLDAEGRVLERSVAAPSEDLLSAYVAQRNAGVAHLLWPAMLEGRLSVVPRGTGRRSRYFVLENPPSSQSIRALTPSEVAVLSQAAHGHSTKLIAFALGISPSVVSARLASAASKLGVATRMELVRLAAMLSRDPRSGFENIALTDAERDVLELVQRGLSNEAIAAMRSRSVRTIANQVASLLRKTNAGSRRALIVGSGRDG